MDIPIDNLQIIVTFLPARLEPVLFAEVTEDDLCFGIVNRFVPTRGPFG